MAMQTAQPLVGCVRFAKPSTSPVGAIVLKWCQSFIYRVRFEMYPTYRESPLY